MTKYQLAIQNRKLWLEADSIKDINIFRGMLLISTLALLPAYIFPSGGFQVVDIPLVLIIGVTLFSSHQNYEYLKETYYFLPYVIWACIVNGGYAIVTGELSFIKGFLPYIYAPVLMYTFIIIYSKILHNDKLSYIYIGIGLSIVATFLFKGLSEESERAILSFNDPNQLAYFALIILVYAILLINYKLIKQINNSIYFYLDIIIILMAHFFLALSLSRSAMAAFFVIDLCLLRLCKNVKIALPLIFIGLIAVIFFFIKNPTFIQDRLAVRGPQNYQSIEKNIEQRALEPLKLMSGFQVIIGRGSAITQTLKSSVALKKSYKGFKGESHNILGEVFRATGIIGITLFSYWLLQMTLASRQIQYGIWLWIALLVYNMGNYGVRFRAFWILLAFLLAMIGHLQDKKEGPEAII